MRRWPGRVVEKQKLTPVHCMRVCVDGGSDGDEVTLPDEILAHGLTGESETEGGRPASEFLDEAGEVVVAVPVHLIAEFVLAQGGLVCLLLDVLVSSEDTETPEESVWHVSIWDQRN
jgi:hypothetical protein